MAIGSIATAFAQSPSDTFDSHIDTAEMYGNEKEVGQAVRDSGVKREEIFISEL